MGIEFRLASGDHLKLEDLLSHAPEGRRTTPAATSLRSNSA